METHVQSSSCRPGSLAALVLVLEVLCQQLRVFQPLRVLQVAAEGFAEATEDVLWKLTSNICLESMLDQLQLTHQLVQRYSTARVKMFKAAGFEQELERLLLEVPKLTAWGCVICLWFGWNRSNVQRAICLLATHLRTGR